MRRAVAGLLTLVVAATAAAAPGPAPDPSEGERTDGKIHDPKRAEAALTVPRILLSPLRLTLRLIGEPVRGILWLDSRHHVFQKIAYVLTSEDGLRGLRPVIRYLSRFEPQLGVTYFDKKLLGKGSSLSATVGAVLPKLIFADAAVEPHLPTRYGLRLAAGYLRRDDAAFDGVGLASPGGLRENGLPRSRVGIESVDASARFRIKLHRFVRIDLTEAYAWRRYDNGRRDDEELPIAQVYCGANVHQRCIFPTVDAAAVPGFYTGAQTFSTDASLVFDTRVGSYGHGWWLHLDGGARYAQTPSRDGPAWIESHASVAGALPIHGPSRSLILRIALEDLEPINDAVVPFTELVTLGGPNSLRGAPVGRYRDFSSVLATLEYRWAIWMWMDASLFTDWGGTFGRHFEGFAFDRLLPDVGGGLEVHTAHHFLVRAQLAYGFVDGVQFMFATRTEL